MAKNKKTKNKEPENFIQDNDKLSSLIIAGDYRHARAIAKETLSDPGSSESSRSAARETLERTQFDRGALLAGFSLLATEIALACLLYLF